MIKRPLDYVASAVRATDADSDAGKAMLTHVAAMGQVAHGWPMPDGYPMRTAAWTGSMLPRWNFASSLAHGNMTGTHTGDFGDSAFQATHGRRPHESDHELLAACAGQDLPAALALCLASPSFQWK
jgi:uncharacterized protein (DUF1800 family)